MWSQGVVFSMTLQTSRCCIPYPLLYLSRDVIKQFILFVTYFLSLAVLSPTSPHVANKRHIPCFSKTFKHTFLSGFSKKTVASLQSLSPPQTRPQTNCHNCPTTPHFRILHRSRIRSQRERTREEAEPNDDAHGGGLLERRSLRGGAGSGGGGGRAERWPEAGQRAPSVGGRAERRRQCGSARVCARSGEAAQT